MYGARPARAVTAAAIGSTSSTRYSPPCRATGTLFSLPTPHRWSLVMATSGFALPSTLLSTACSPEQPGGNAPLPQGSSLPSDGLPGGFIGRAGTSGISDFDCL